MTEYIQRYFDFFKFDNGPAPLQRLEEVFVEAAVFQYSGERVLGLKALVEYHQKLSSAWKSSAVTWHTTSEDDESLTAEWSQTYTESDGQTCVRSGKIIAQIASNGLIRSLYTVLEHDTKHMGRVLLGKHVDVWWSRDADERLEMMKEIYTDDVSFADPAAPAQGHVELNARIAQTPLLNDYRIGQFYSTFDHLLYSWETQLEDGSRLTGWEYLHFHGDMIDSFSVFTDTAYAGLA
jgi:hypothetical protein